MRSVLIMLAAAFAAVASAEVLHLTASDFDSYVGKDKGAFIKFYAPWCGHCKSMAPDYETFSQTFGNDNVVIAKVNADDERDLAARFGVSGYPTLKWFPKGSLKPEDYQGGRTADDLISFVNGKIGTNRKIAKPTSAVIDLDDSNFDEIIGQAGKYKLVEFFAPWCGHCKSLAPTYEKVAAAFESDSEVVIAKVDADKYRHLGERFHVSGFPTIKYFGPSGDRPEDVVQEYTSGREGDDFVRFINEQAGTHRTLSGDLLPTAGRIKAFDDLAKQYLSVKDDHKRGNILEEARQLAAAEVGAARTKAEAYLKVMERVAAKGVDWVSKELSRVEGMLKSPSIGKHKKTEFSIRRNVLSAFNGDSE